ncbi:MAG TPA: DUF2585 domain-containing protein [Pseudolabrys sp.]|nr:DUF2585 domain-containing protein [Pseudolabrys sp.]
MRSTPARVPVPAYLAAVAALLALQAVVLHAYGQPPICTCGTVRLWAGDVLGPENSQQLLDWYSFSHVIHGIGFYFLLWLVAPRTPVLLRLALAVGIEVSWELIENTPSIIGRYRQQALAQGYVGDSIVNSLSDTCCAIFGFLLARKLPPWGSLALVVALEVFVAAMIHDNLTLNIIQLIHPLPAISHWQAGG